MSVQVFDQLSEMEEALTSGQWSSRGTASPVLVEVVIDPRWLADLHDPSLVITRGFVGPDRRRSDRSGDVPLVGRSHGVDLFRRLVQVVAMTLAVVVPLALINARSVPPAPATRATPGATAPAAGPAAAPGTRNHIARHTLGATPLRVARVDAAKQRALARQQSTGAHASVAPAVGSAPLGRSGTSGIAGSRSGVSRPAPAVTETRSASRAARDARSASRVKARDARSASRVKARDARSASRATAADARAAAAARRADRMMARSANVSGLGRAEVVQ